MLTGSRNRSTKGQEAAEQSIRIAKNAVTTVENLIFVAQQRILSASNHPMVAAARYLFVCFNHIAFGRYTAMA